MIELKCNGHVIDYKMNGDAKRIISEISMIYCKLCERFAEEVREPVESIMLDVYQSSSIAIKRTEEIKEALEKLENYLPEGDEENAED